jgi:hypothetical protein
MRMVLQIAHQVEALAGSERFGGETSGGMAFGKRMACLSKKIHMASCRGSDRLRFRRTHAGSRRAAGFTVP